MKDHIGVITPCCETLYHIESFGRQMCKCGNIFAVFMENKIEPRTNT